MKCLLPASLVSVTTAIQLTISDTSNVKSVAATLAYDMMTLYTGNQTGQIPGILPGGMNCNPSVANTYCWWESGGMWGALINYWQYTGDTSYNPTVTQAIQFQRGADNDFNPANQSRGMGIDDQSFWAFTALDAVEANFPEAGNGAPSWLALAQAVFNFQYPYWDATTCGGGFHWQVYKTNAGWNLKNLISNGGNFQLSARLAYITGNSSYADWAETVYEWIDQSHLYQRDENDGILYIWDNTDSDNNCTTQTNYVWTYNYGVMLAGAAYMYNYTNGSDVWMGRVNEILNSTYSLFFPQQFGGNIMSEIQCEPTLNCNQDQKSFKTFLSRWMAVTALLVPSTADGIKAKLAGSAVGAAGQCDGGSSGRVCGERWYQTTYDGTIDEGNEMAALSVIGSTLNRQDLAPLSLNTGATSQSDPGAGLAGAPSGITFNTITTADKAGAAILTILIILVTIGSAAWLVM